MSQNNLFAGFAAFEAAPLPEGALNIQYGLSTQVIEITAEAQVAPETGVTPRQLAERYARMFNMPTTGIVCYADGQEIGLDTPIPTQEVRVVEKIVEVEKRVVENQVVEVPVERVVEKIIEKPVYRNIEFRQPAGEKGNDYRIVRVVGKSRTIPLTAEQGALVLIAFEDTTEVIEYIPVEEGKVSISLQDKVASMGLEILSRGRQYLNVGHFDLALRAIRKNPRCVAKISRRIGSELDTPITVGDVLEEVGEVLRVELNGVSAESGWELEVGDQLAVILKGETNETRFDVWEATQKQMAQGAVWVAYHDREDAMASRKAELEAMNGMHLRALALTKGIKAAGKGRTAEVIKAEILEKEFPPVDDEAVYAAALAELAPELLGLPPLYPLGIGSTPPEVEETLGPEIFEGWNPDLVETSADWEDQKDEEDN